MSILKQTLIGAFSAGALASASVNAAPDAHRWRDMTPWFVDAIKIQRGIQPELDWESPEAPRLEDVQLAIDARPVLSGPEYTVETEHFIIHYTDEGKDAASEEQVQWSATSLEEVWQREVEEMGYAPPPSDGTKGGDSRYDVYWTFQLGTYGYCAGESFVDENSMTSYLALANWMGEVETYVTVAHEFFHALHYGMDALEETWWFESTATWMEDQVYDDINDYYNYIPDVFENPEQPVNGDTSLMYGYAIYVHSLSERYGIDIVKEIWLDASESIAAQATEMNMEVVNRHGDWDETFQNFRESLWDLDRFEEGSDYAMAIGSNGEPGEVSFTTTVTSYSKSGQGTMAPTGCNLIEFEATGDGPGTLEVNYSGGTDLVASLLVETSDGDIVEYASDTEKGAGAVFTLASFGTAYTRAVLVVSHTGLDGDSSFSYTASVPEWDDGGSTCSLNKTTGARTGLSLGALMLLSLSGLALRRRRLV